MATVGNVDQVEFPLVNHQEGNPRFGMFYKEVKAGSEVFHVYSDGQVERLVERTPPSQPDVTVSVQNPSPAIQNLTNPTPVNPLITNADPPAAASSFRATIPTTGGDSDTAKMQAEIEALRAQLSAKANTQASALTVPITAADPNITLGQLEPGLVWGIRQGLFKASDIGSHIVDLLDLEAGK